MVFPSRTRGLTPFICSLLAWYSHLVAMRAQQFGLLSEDLILTSWQLVEIVHGENFHHAPCLPRMARFTICFHTLWVSNRSTARWKSGRGRRLE